LRRGEEEKRKLEGASTFLLPTRKGEKSKRDDFVYQRGKNGRGREKERGRGGFSFFYLAFYLLDCDMDEKRKGESQRREEEKRGMKKGGNGKRRKEAQMLIRNKKEEGKAQEVASSLFKKGRGRGKK